MVCDLEYTIYINISFRGDAVLRNRFHFPIGWRTLKTGAAVILAMIVVDSYGATTSKLIFAMLGAMEAVQPTFKDSMQACLTQIVGVLFGSLAGILLLMLPVSHLIATGAGIILVITVYNLLHIRFSPSLPCFIVVMICITPDIRPISYAAGRIWDTAIGLGIGVLINTLIVPYDSRRQVRSTLSGLDSELKRFLEDVFDGDSHLPDAEDLSKYIRDADRHLQIFTDQKLFMRPSRRRRELRSFRSYDKMVHQLVAHMEVLCRMERPGRLNMKNRSRLRALGIPIYDERALDSVMEIDVVTNYHVDKVLTLRRELLEILN